VPHPNVVEIVRSEPHSGFATLGWGFSLLTAGCPTQARLTGDVQISPILSSCPEQITAKAMTKNHE
jgi:hypothetical protein